MSRRPVYFSNIDRTGVTEQHWRHTHPDHHVFVRLNMARGQVLDGGLQVIRLMNKLFQATGIELGGCAWIVPVCISRETAFYGDIFHAADIDACARLHTAINEIGLPEGVTYERKNSMVVWATCYTRVKCIGRHDGPAVYCRFCAAYH